MLLYTILLSNLISFCLAAYGYPVHYLRRIPPVDFCYADADKSDINYYLFKSLSQCTAITLNETNYVLPFNDSKTPVKILVHGYTSNISAPWIKPMKEAYFLKGAHNIIYVDWSAAARDNNYTISAANISPVADYISDFIIGLQIPLKNIHIIGHSLGGHLAGFIGKYIFWKTGKKVARITANDPAGPGFDNVIRDLRLNPQDATFVDVVHTDIGYFGAVSPLGHVDFYVNGGKNQPGCKSHETDENCHHVRSSFYFVESINKRNVMAKAAELNEKEEIVVNKDIQEIEFGDPVSTKARGIYYLKTNAASPYLNAKQK